MTTSRKTQAPQPGYSAAGEQEQILKRLRRIEGQVRGIAGMVEDERYCIDVLQQISAAQAALDKVALALVDDHTRHCVLGASPANQEEKRAGTHERPRPARRPALGAAARRRSPR